MVTLSVLSGCGMLQGVTSVAAIGGVATFRGLSVDYAGEYVLTASVSGSNDAVFTAESNSFTVSAGAVTAMAFKINPSNAATGKAFATQPVVVMLDVRVIACVWGMGRNRIRITRSSTLRARIDVRRSRQRALGCARASAPRAAWAREAPRASPRAGSV